MQLNDQPLAFGDDYIPLARPADVTAAPLCLREMAGFSSRKISMLTKAVDAKGKIAIIFCTAQCAVRRVSAVPTCRQARRRLDEPGEYAQKQGAVGIVIVPDFQYLANWDRNRSAYNRTRINYGRKVSNLGRPQLAADSCCARVDEQLVSGREAEARSLFERAQRGKLPESFALNPDKKLTLSVKVKSERRDTQNVVAVFEGSDPVLKNEYVALGAHYDHVGVGIAGEWRRDL